MGTAGFKKKKGKPGALISGFAWKRLSSNTRDTHYERANEKLQKEGENIFFIDIYFYLKVEGQLVSSLLTLLA